MDLHDAWNIYALGALNVLHVGWWAGVLAGPRATSALFAADAAYIALDTAWLALVPSCVAPRVRLTLLAHHLVMNCCTPVAWGKPVHQRHLLRTWCVELQSWTHIAARALRPGRLRRACDWINRPLYVLLRLVAFPLAWVLYSRERAALPAAVLAAHTPAALHAALTLVHFALYGLMLKWGATLLLARGKDS